MTHYSTALIQTLLKRFPDADSFPYRSWCYPQGLMLWGMVRQWEYTGDRRLRAYVLQYASGHTAEDGSISGFSGDSMDDMMAGSILAWAYEQTHERRYQLACEKIFSCFKNYPRTSAGAFWHSRNLPGEFWVDGVFMGQMFLLEYARVFGAAEECWQETAKQIRLAHQCCQKGGTGLLYHAFSENPDTAWADPHTQCSPEVWSEGLGWYALILTRAFQRIPPEHPAHAEITRYYINLLEALLRTQDAQSGLWYQIVDRAAEHDNWCDTSGSAMFAYALLCALPHKLIDSKACYDAVQRAYHGLLNNIETASDGLLNIYNACDGLCVQPDYNHYVFYPKRVNAKEAVGAVLWFVIEYDHFFSE